MKDHELRYENFIYVRYFIDVKRHSANQTYSTIGVVRSVWCLEMLVVGICSVFFCCFFQIMEK